MLVLVVITLQAVSAEDNATISDEISISDESELTVSDDTQLGADEDEIVIEPVTVSSPYQTGAFTFKITDKNTGEAVVDKSVDFSVYLSSYQISYPYTRTVKTDSAGIATFYLNELDSTGSYISDSGLIPAGDYNLTVKGGDGLTGNLTTQVTVEKATVVITPDSYEVELGSAKNFTMRVTSNGVAVKAARLSMYLEGGEEYVNTILCDENGVGQIPVNLSSIGEYKLIIYTDDTSLNSARTTGKIIINGLKTVITVESTVKYYNSGDTVVLRLTDASGKVISGMDVQILIDGVSYVQNPDKNGRIRFSTSVNVGTHTLEVNIGGTTYRGSLKKTFTVKKAEAKLASSNKKVYYKSGKYLTTKLTNSKTKKAIFNAKIRIKVKTSSKRMSTFYGTTGSDGKIKFNINLKPGTYKLEITGDDSKNFKAKKITSKLVVKKSPVKITAKKSGKKIQIKTVNKKSKKAASGVKLNIKVYTGKSYKTYTGKTGSAGLAAVSASSGSHKVVVSVSDSCYSAKTYKKTVKI